MNSIYEAISTHLAYLLYELLTGTLPLAANRLQNATMEQMLRYYRETEPLSPSRRLRQAADQTAPSDKNQITGTGITLKKIRDDLDWIVMKSLAKEIERRYQTVAELQVEVVHYLEDQPVNARPPSMIYNARKFIRRNRVLVTAAMLALLALVGGLTTAIISSVRANQARIEAEAVSAFLQKILSEPDPHRVGVEARVIDVINYAESHFETDFPDNQEFEAKIRTIIGITLTDLADYEKGMANLLKARALTRELKGEDHHQSLEIEYQIMRSLQRQKKYEQALDLGEDLNAKQAKTLGPFHRLTLKTLFLRGETYRLHNDPSTALNLLDQAHGHQLSLFGEEDIDTIQSQVAIGACYFKQNNYMAARDIFERALPLQVQVSGSSSPDTLATKRTLANTYRRLGENNKAASLYEEIIRSRSKIMGSHPSTYSAKYGLASCLLNLQRYEEAEALIQEIIDYRSERYGPVEEPMINIRLMLGYLFQEKGDKEKALTIYREIFSDCERFNIKNTNNGLIVIGHLGLCLLDAGRPREAIDFLEQEMETIVKVGIDRPRARVILNHLGKAYREIEAYKDADHYFSLVWERTQLIAPEDSNLYEFGASYGENLIDLGCYENSEKVLLTSLALAQQTYDANTESVCLPLARLYLTWGEKASSSFSSVCE